jgi:anti-anti-sigma regulatory factor
MGRRAIAVEQTAGPEDRCPFRRPFEPGFSGCATFQPVSFVAADSMNKQLGTVLTCGHLTTGIVAGASGRYYPRCGLGGPSERERWLAGVGASRLEKVRALQAEFDAFSRPYREELFAAKARAVALTGAAEHRRSLERRMGDFLDAAEAFLEAREERFDEVGLPVGPLMQLMREWSWAWTASRELANERFSEDPLLPFAPRPVAGAAKAKEASAVKRKPAAKSAIYADAALVITRTSDPPGLRFEGEIDASNAAAVSQSLAIAAVVPGDFYLDLGALRFCDLEAFRAMVQTARTLGAGRRLVVEGMPGYLWRAMRIIGWADLPNLVMRPGAEVGEPA